MAYTERRNTEFEHADEIKAEFGLHDFEAREKELRDWADGRSWMTGKRPEGDLRGRGALAPGTTCCCPGVTTLAQLVAAVRDEANQRLWETLHGLLSAGRVLLASLTKMP